MEQDNNGAYTEIVYSPTGARLALMDGQTLTKAFVALPAGATAVYNSSGLEYYRHADWLGSSRLTSTPGRTVSGDVAYAPFGETYAQSGSPDLSFTGQDAGISSTLYDFMYREYGIQGRWESPDPLGPAAFNLADPQTLDLYAYVRNSPMILTDPLGMAPCPDGSVDSSGNCTVIVNGNGENGGTPSVGCWPVYMDGAYVGISCGPGVVVGKGNGMYGNGWGNAGSGGSSDSGAPQAPPQTQTTCASPSFAEWVGAKVLGFFSSVTGKALGVGYGGAAALGVPATSGTAPVGVEVDASRQLVALPNGQAVLETTVGGGLTTTAGGGAVGGLEFSVSNATSPLGLAGGFAQVSGGYGDIFGGGGSVAWNPASGTWQATATGGVGVGGFGAVGGGSNTTVQPVCQAP